MAINLGQALLALGADASGLNKDLDKAKGTTLGWIDDLGRSVVAGVGGVVVAGVGAAVAGATAVGIAALHTANQAAEATGRLQTQLGLTREEAEALGDVAVRVYGDNFGESIGDAAEAVSDVREQLGDLPLDELQKVTEQALAIRDAFDIEVSESMGAVNALMTEFGLTSAEAIAFVYNGLAQGLNASDDFLETLGEYSNLFGEAGASAGEFFSLLSTGSLGGVLGTDKVADAFKEFTIRIRDGSDTTREGLEGIGLDADRIFAMLESGQLSMVDVFAEVSRRMRWSQDDMADFRYGTMLVGTQLEDMGLEAFEALSLTTKSTEDATTAAGDLNAQYNNMGDFLEGLKRRAQVALLPVGEVMLDVANRAMPLIEQAFGALEPVLQRAATWAGNFVDTFIQKVEEGTPPLEAFKETVREMTPPEQADAIVSFVDSIATRGAEMAPALGDIAKGIGMLADSSSENDWEGLHLVGEGLKALFGISDDDPATIVLANIATGLRLLGDATDEWQEGDRFGALSTLSDAVLAFFGADQEDVDNLLVNVAAGITVLGERIAEWGKPITQFMDELWETLERANDSLTFFLEMLWGLMSGRGAGNGSWLDDWMPDWLIPGSPTPFEIGIRGINDALGETADRFSRLRELLAAGMDPALAAAAAGAYYMPGSEESGYYSRNNNPYLDRPPRPPANDPRSKAAGVTIEKVEVNVSTNDPAAMANEVVDEIQRAMRRRGLV